MANVLRRLSFTLKRGLDALLEPAADPRQTFADAYVRQRELLAKVKQARLENATARARLENRAQPLRERLPRLEERARQALGAGREDLARSALQQRQAAQTELRVLESHVAEVQKEGGRLALVEQRLSTQIEAFRAKQEVIAARYSAAEAQVRLTEAFHGLSDEWADLGATLEQAEARAETLLARASAMDQLAAENVLTPNADLSLAALDFDEEVEAQLRVMKAEV